MSLLASSADDYQPIVFSLLGNVKKLGETYPKISNAQNAELRLRWGQIILKNDHQEEFWKVKEFLQSQVGNCISGPLTGPGCLPSHLRSSCRQSLVRPCVAWPLTDLPDHAGVGVISGSFVLGEEQFAGLGSSLETSW